MEANGTNPNIVRMEILFDQVKGTIQVNGPVENPIFCYGLLECARQSIQQHNQRKAEGNRIVPANVLPLVRN